MDDCIFCKIVKGGSPVEILFETERAVAFKEARPLAPIHFLIVTKQHQPSAISH